jgi:hypothetical protein
MLAHDKHEHLDLMAVKFLAKSTRYAVYVFAFAAYAHFIPALSGLGAASLTSIGVESTARFAFEYGFNQIFVEDAMTAMSAEEHALTVAKIFPRIGLVRKTGAILSDLLND